jgi:hypothetical protein
LPVFSWLASVRRWLAAAESRAFERPSNLADQV